MVPSWFSPEEAASLPDFWTIYSAHFGALNASAMKAVLAEPELAALVASMTPEQLEQNQRDGYARMKKLMEGDWDDYVQTLRVQGVVYAKLGVSFSTWYRLIRIAARDLTPLIVQTYAREPERLSRTLVSMQAFFDWAMSMLAEVYLGTKEADLKAMAQDLATTLNSIGDGVIATDLQGVVTRINPVAEQLTGWSSHEARGKALGEVFHIVNEQTNAPVENPAERVLKEGVIIGLANHTALIAKDGSRRPIADSAAPIRDESGSMRGVVLVFRDETAKYQAEAARVRSNQLETDNRRIQEANRLKSEFLANMSHELRTPLNAIIGFADLLHDDQVPYESPQFKEFLGDILKSGRHLLQLINDVLDLSKVEAGRVDFFPELVSLHRTISEIAAILRTTSASKRITISVDVDSTLDSIFIDSGRLKQVLYNYLSNALKFTPEGGQISVRGVAEGDRQFRVEVEDSGIGIEPKDISKLFIEFQQLDAGAGKKHAGTGLGLALTRRLAEAQGGSVGVTSTPGKGSTFHVVLPRVAEGRPVVASRRIAGVAGAPVILVIEDTEKDQLAIVETLTAAGYEVETASNAAQATERCAARTFDAITLDLLLPDASGLDVLRVIRSGDKNRDVPVIVITVVTESGAAGGFVVHDILAKPLDEEAILHSLARAGIKNGNAGYVLVVDDDPNSGKLMATTLGQFNYRVVSTESGTEGLKLSLESPPTAVILDLLMPEMDGFEFLERFRAQKQCTNIPVIVWSAKDLTPDELYRLKASAQGVLQKGQDAGAAVLGALRAFLPPTTLPEA